MKTRPLFVWRSVAVVIVLILASGRNAPAATAEVKTIVGSPTLLVDGKPTAPLLNDLPTEPFGSQAKLSPLWTVRAGAGVKPLATLSTGETLVAAKQDADGLRIYVGTTDAPAAFLRNVLKVSGVHVYVDSDDVISADGSFVALTATEADTKRVMLPEPKTVRDLFDGHTVGKKISSFGVRMVQGETRLFVLSAK